MTKDQYQIFFELSADALLIISNDTFVDCNDGALKMLRYAKKEDLLKTHVY